MKLKEKELAGYLKKIEFRLCSGELNNNPELVNKLIHDDFIEFGSSGNIWNKKSVIKSFEDLSNRKCSITEFNVVILAEDAVLVTYKAVIKEKNLSSESLRSSIWKKFGEEWKIIFHQSTRMKKFHS